MFPRIPDDPHYVYPVREPSPPPVDSELLLRHIDYQIARAKFYRDRAVRNQMLEAQAVRAEDMRMERVSREARGIFGPMDKRYVLDPTQLRGKKKDIDILTA